MARARLRAGRGRLVALRKESRLMLLVLGTFIAGYCVSAHLIAYHGMRYLLRFPLVGALLSERMVFLAFAFVFVMLVFSNIVVGYSTLFKNRETAWLLTLPVRRIDVYRWKGLESLWVSSWALLVLAAPVVAAYGRVKNVAPIFYLETFLLFAAFVVIPGMIGSWVLLLLARMFARPWFKWTLLAVAVGGGIAMLLAMRPASEYDPLTIEGTVSFDQLMRHTRPSLNPWFPGAWAARSLLAWADGLPSPGWFFFGVLAANALLVLLLGFDLASRAFYRGWNDVASTRALRVARRHGSALKPDLTEKILDGLFWLSPPIRALAAKDLRLFWRDPVQWTQFLVFFALLGIYVLNLRNVSFEMRNPFWEEVVSHLNLAASALTLSTLTTRFVYPQFSLEGRRLWMVGLAPIGLDRLLGQKFGLAFTMTTGTVAILMILSSITLGLDGFRVAYFLFAMALISAGLSGLAVGLGALFPNLKEDNPSKIVSGFGGTLCLVVSFLYVTGSVALLAVPGIKRVIPAFGPVPDGLAISGAGLLAFAAGSLPMGLARARVKQLSA
jgi:ABC-2 type transport system permease protein